VPAGCWKRVRTRNMRCTWRNWPKPTEAVFRTLLIFSNSSESASEKPLKWAQA
jgi:hypothetical protein